MSCSPGFDGGLTQIFILEVGPNNLRRESSLNGVMIIDLRYFGWQFIGMIFSKCPQIFDPDSRAVVKNMSRVQPRFYFEDLFSFQVLSRFFKTLFLFEIRFDKLIFKVCVDWYTRANARQHTSIKLTFSSPFSLLSMLPL